MTMSDPKLNEALQRFSDELAEQYPEIGVILAKLRAGEMGEVEAMGLMANLVAEKGLGPNIEQIAETAFGPADTAMIPVSPGTTPLVYQKTGLPRLNPLIEAAIAERVQYDGDVPELRSGPMPEGSKPAVPVEFKSRDPVALGLMLEAASNEVADEIVSVKMGWQGAAKQIVAAGEEEGLPEDALLARVQSQLPARPIGVPGYEPGQLPAIRKVAEPTGSALGAMTTAQKQTAAYTALSTTQGRRSALEVIEELILVGLEGDGFKMKARPPGRSKSVPIHAQWTLNVSGSESTQSNFSFIDLAAKSLLRQLVEQLATVTVEDPVLEVTTVNTVDIRKVGWAARIVPQAA